MYTINLHSYVNFDYCRYEYSQINHSRNCELLIITMIVFFYLILSYGNIIFFVVNILNRPYICISYLLIIFLLIIAR